MGRHEQSRREFMRDVAAGTAALSAPAVLQAGNRDDRPNILFCLSDNHSYPDAGAYGTAMVDTPAFDRVAREGALFHNAYVSKSSCCPSRASILTGQHFYRLKEASQNFAGGLRRSYPTYTRMLREAGYHVGYTGKGFGPTGRPSHPEKMVKQPCGRAYNRRKTEPPTSEIYNVDYGANLREFLADRDENQPFCFWYGCREPHRDYEFGSGLAAGKKLENARVPDYLPDAPPVRKDLLDYALEIEWFDRHLGRMLQALENVGELDNTIIVVTGDNGMQFPRAMTTCYDSGTREPLAIRWGDRMEPGQEITDLVSFVDFAPTFLDAAGMSPPAEMNGRSMVQLLTGGSEAGDFRDHVIMGRERHHPKADPLRSRAIRTDRYLYIRNYNPGHTWAGEQKGPYNPETSMKSLRVVDEKDDFLDVDPSPTKVYMLQHRREHPGLYRMAFGPRPAEELYDVREDRYQLHNLAAEPAHSDAKKRLRRRLRKILKETGDPRALGNPEAFDDYFNEEWLSQWAEPS